MNTLREAGIQMFSPETLLATFKEAEELSTRIKAMPEADEKRRTELLHWFMVGAETQKLMIQAEEQCTHAQLLLLKANVRGTSCFDLWAKYRESFWPLYQPEGSSAEAL